MTSVKSMKMLKSWVLKDEMILDRLVVGLTNDKLSENLQINSGLTLKQAVQQHRHCENVKKQQRVIRWHPCQISVGSLTASKSWRPGKKTISKKLKQPSRVSGDGPKNCTPDRQITRCERCRYHQRHNRKTCPAKDARCHKRSKQGVKINCAKIVSKVDANSRSGFWQRKLSLNSKLLTTFITH